MSWLPMRMPWLVLRMPWLATRMSFISVGKFKKFMACYFLTVFLGFLFYINIHHGTGLTETSKQLRDGVSDSNSVGANDSKQPVRTYDLNQSRDALIEQVDNKLRAIASKKGGHKTEQENPQLDDKLPSEEELQMMIDALHYALPTHALGLEDIWPNISSTVTPDYFARSIAYSQDYVPDSAPDSAQVTPNPGSMGNHIMADQEGLKESNNGLDITSNGLGHGPDDGPDSTSDSVSDNASDNGPDFDLDRFAGVYEESLADYVDDTIYEIPHIIHQTWNTAQVPEQVAPWVRSWTYHNPFWLHWFWTERGFLDMLLHHFTEHYDIYRKYEEEVNKADMRKYFLMFKEGGIVSDLDIECQQPLDDTLLETQCILVREPDIHREMFFHHVHIDLVNPAFMACRPGHPFFRFLIDHLREFAEAGQHMTGEDRITNSTGTMFLSQVLYRYRQQLSSTADDVYLAPAEQYLASFDQSRQLELRVKCNGYKMDTTLTIRQKEVCEYLTQNDFENKFNYNSVTYHHWMGTWKPNYNPGPTEHISIIQPGITLFDR